MNRRDFLHSGAALLSLTLPCSVSAGVYFSKSDSYNIDCTGVRDSTLEFQRLLNDAATAAKPVKNGMQKSLIIVNGIIKLSKTIHIDASKINIVGPATIYFSEESAEVEYGFILNNNSKKNVSFTNGVGSLFDSINFYSEAKINLFFASNLRASDSNPSCLINISQCRFTGFDKVFVNGAGGWGWNWDRCGFNECNWLLYLTQQMDSYERFSFSSCIWQNGGTAFYVNNPFGKIYWTAGSFDHCQGIAYIKKGYVSVSGHLEIKKINNPVVIIMADDSHFYFTGGSIYIISCKNPFTLFKQFKDGQITLRDVNIMYDKTDDSEIKLSDMNILKDNVSSRKRDY